MISIVVNGKEIEIERPVSVSDYLDQIGLAGRSVAVAINSEVLQAGEYAATIIGAGDRVEVVRPIGGG